MILNRHNNSRHVRVQDQQAGLAPPHAGDFGRFHGQPPFGAFNRMAKVGRGPIDNVFGSDVVVSPQTLHPDRENHNDVASLVAVSDRATKRAGYAEQIAGKGYRYLFLNRSLRVGSQIRIRCSEKETYNVKDHDIIINSEFSKGAEQDPARQSAARQMRCFLASQHAFYLAPTRVQQNERCGRTFYT